MNRCNERATYLFDGDDLTADLLNTLRTGAENGMTSKQLQAMFGITFRDLRLIVERCRRTGVYIIASNEGYFFPSTADEVQRFLKRENAHLLSLTQTLQPLREYAGSLEVIEWQHAECSQSV